MKIYEVLLGVAAILLCLVISGTVLLQNKTGKGLSGAVFGVSEQMKGNIKGANKIPNRIVCGCLFALCLVALAMDMIG